MQAVGAGTDVVTIIVVVIIVIATGRKSDGQNAHTAFTGRDTATGGVMHAATFIRVITAIQQQQQPRNEWFGTRDR